MKWEVTEIAFFLYYTGGCRVMDNLVTREYFNSFKMCNIPILSCYLVLSASTVLVKQINTLGLQ